MSSLTQRKSNIELLRILTMCGVIALHYNNAQIGGGFVYAEGINKVILYFIEGLCIGSVNIFVLISGYFMCLSNKRTIIKPLSLIFEIIVISLGIFLLKIIIDSSSFSIKGLLGCFIPANYFIILYSVVYFISPGINRLFDNIDKKTASRLLTVLVLIFSVYPTLVDLFSEITEKEWMGLSSIGAYGSQRGYSAINFILMYIIGVYLRKYDDGYCNRKKSVLLLIGIAAILVIWAMPCNIILFETEKSAWGYCNPLVILLAVVIFRLFNSFNIKNNRVINEISKASFTVFLLQNYFLVNLNIAEYVDKNCLIMLLHMLIVIVAIYCISYVLFKIYDITVQKLFDYVFKRVHILNKDIYEDCFKDVNT